MLGTVSGLAEYTPRHPNLAKLQITVSGEPVTAGYRDRRADIFAQRFGYRQMKVEGTQFLWNGRPKRLLGSFQHGPVQLFARQEGIEATRNYNVTGDFLSLDLYDEIGNMTYLDLDSTGAMGWKWLNNTHFHDSSTRCALACAWTTGYHPSVVGYDMTTRASTTIRTARAWRGRTSTAT